MQKISAKKSIGHDLVEKVIHWELCKFDHTNIWYIHNLETIVENRTRKILWDFVIQMDHIITSLLPDLGIVNKEKRTCRIMDFAVPADLRVILKK